jgi:hypothetical protein
MVKTEEEKARDRERRDRIDALMIEQLPKFVEHFGQLRTLVDELTKIRVILDERLTQIAAVGSR